MAENDETVPGMAEAVEARMKELRIDPGRFAERADLTRQGLTPVRKGIRRNYQDRLVFGVAEALLWESDWYERLLAGEPPRELSGDKAGIMLALGDARETRHLADPADDPAKALEYLLQRLPVEEQERLLLAELERLRGGQ